MIFVYNFEVGVVKPQVLDCAFLDLLMSLLVDCLLLLCREIPEAIYIMMIFIHLLTGKETMFCVKL